MLVIAALILYASLTGFVYHSLLLSHLVVQGMETKSKFKYPFYLLRALFFNKESTKRMRQSAFGLWVSSAALLVNGFFLLASHFSWFN